MVLGAGVRDNFDNMQHFFTGKFCRADPATRPAFKMLGRHIVRVVWHESSLAENPVAMFEAMRPSLYPVIVWAAGA